jgi:hypothetical protein
MIFRYTSAVSWKLDFSIPVKGSFSTVPSDKARERNLVSALCRTCESQYMSKRETQLERSATYLVHSFLICQSNQISPMGLSSLNIRNSSPEYYIDDTIPDLFSARCIKEQLEFELTEGQGEVIDQGYRSFCLREAIVCVF